MNSFFDKAKDLVDQHDDKVDQALDKIGDVIDDKTGNKYSDQIDKGVTLAQEKTGDGNTTQP